MPYYHYITIWLVFCWSLDDTDATNYYSLSWFMIASYYNDILLTLYKIDIMIYGWEDWTPYNTLYSRWKKNKFAFAITSRHNWPSSCEISQPQNLKFTWNQYNHQPRQDTEIERCSYWLLCHQKKYHRLPGWWLFLKQFEQQTFLLQQILTNQSEYDLQQVIRLCISKLQVSLIVNW